ncbi:MAG: putative membrane protein [Candidatus Methanohalarchaeum thermophilum]|uniref:Membrane protein n=1 Tax=Methanohalarchaeum thermophilum TaxID=1903181 RepID=A0A1Q6DS83_METT1|nr:MAG: putative membrane protein [Candidatus Methanohalarchaeum thermophilum]
MRDRGLLFGFSFGVAISFAVDDFALWIAIGMALGVIFDSYF